MSVRLVLLASLLEVTLAPTNKLKQHPRVELGVNTCNNIDRFNEKITTNPKEPLVLLNYPVVRCITM